MYVPIGVGLTSNKGHHFGMTLHDGSDVISQKFQ